MTGVGLAAAAALFYVGLDVLRKLLGQSLSAAQVAVSINLGAAAVFSVILISTGVPHWDWVFASVAAFESVTIALTSILYVQAVTLSPLSLTIPYLGFTPVIAACSAWILLGEWPDWAGFAGIVLVVLGAAALHFEKGRAWSELAAAPFREPGSWRMLLVALIWGSTTALDKIGIAHGSEALLAFCVTFFSALLLLGVLVGQRTGRRSRSVTWRVGVLLLLAALVTGGGVLCQFFAYRELLVAYVETIKRAGGLLSVVIGCLFFREGRLGQRLPAAMLIVVGTLLVAL